MSLRTGSRVKLSPLGVRKWPHGWSLVFRVVSCRRGTVHMRSPTGGDWFCIPSQVKRVDAKGGGK